MQGTSELEINVNFVKIPPSIAGTPIYLLPGIPCQD